MTRMYCYMPVATMRQFPHKKFITKEAEGNESQL